MAALQRAHDPILHADRATDLLPPFATMTTFRTATTKGWFNLSSRNVLGGAGLTALLNLLITLAVPVTAATFAAGATLPTLPVTQGLKLLCPAVLWVIAIAHPEAWMVLGPALSAVNCDTGFIAYGTAIELFDFDAIEGPDPTAGVGLYNPLNVYNTNRWRVILGDGYCWVRAAAVALLAQLTALRAVADGIAAGVVGVARATLVAAAEHLLSAAASIATDHTFHVSPRHFYRTHTHSPNVMVQYTNEWGMTWGGSKYTGPPIHVMRNGVLYYIIYNCIRPCDLAAGDPLTSFILTPKYCRWAWQLQRDDEEEEEEEEEEEGAGDGDSGTDDMDEEEGAGGGDSGPRSSGAILASLGRSRSLGADAAGALRAQLHLVFGGAADPGVMKAEKLLDYMDRHGWIADGRYNMAWGKCGQPTNNEINFSRDFHEVWDRSFEDFGGELGIEQGAVAAHQRGDIAWVLRVEQNADGGWRLPAVQSMPRMWGTQPHHQNYLRSESVVWEQVPHMPFNASADAMARELVVDTFTGQLLRMFG